MVIAVIRTFAEGAQGIGSVVAAATAVLMVKLLKTRSLQYLLATTILSSLFQIIVGILPIRNLMRFLSKSDLTLFFNQLVI